MACDFIKGPKQQSRERLQQVLDVGLWQHIELLTRYAIIDIRGAKGVWHCIHKYLLHSSTSDLENQAPPLLWIYHLKHDTKVAVLLHSKLEKRTEDYVRKVRML